MGGTSDDFEVVCERVKRHFSASRKAMCLARYDVGLEVQTLEADPDRYGAGAVRRIARAVGRNEDSLYDYAKLCDAWARPVFAAFAERPNRRGIPLPLSHFVRIARAPAAEREVLLDFAWETACSVRALERRIEQLGADSAADDATERPFAVALTRAARSLQRTSMALSRFVTSLEDSSDCKPSRRLRTLLAEHEVIAEKLSDELAQLGESGSAAASASAVRPHSGTSPVGAAERSRRRTASADTLQ